jgi:hypothetical protein
MKCPKCGSEIDEELEEAALIVLGVSYVRDPDPPPDHMPKLAALVTYARFLAERALHRCAHEEKVK